MYYNRTISNSFSQLIEKSGPLRWLFEYVKEHEDLDFLIGKNNSKEWISVYRGLSRVLTITPVSGHSEIKIQAAKAYMDLDKMFYGEKSLPVIFSGTLDSLLSKVANNSRFIRYYKNKKEGFYQNELSRTYGICGTKNDDFVIVDKEVVIGYADKNERNKLFGGMQEGYKEMQKSLSKSNPKRYGKNLENKSIGNELDFLALDKEGNILLIEYKHGSNTSGIYLSPLQIGLYYDLFNKLPKKELDDAISNMVEQKKKIGLINPNWKKPEIKNIIPVLIISNYNDKSSAKQKYHEVLKFARSSKGEGFLENIKTYNYTTQDGLLKW